MKFKNLKGERASSNVEIIIWIAIILVVAIALFYFRNAECKFLTGASKNINSLHATNLDEAKHPNNTVIITPLCKNSIFEIKETNGLVLGYATSTDRNNPHGSWKVFSTYDNAAQALNNATTNQEYDNRKVLYSMSENQGTFFEHTITYKTFGNGGKPVSGNWLNYVGSYNDIKNNSGFGDPYKSN